ncbi:MAG: cupin domain-containing protein [Lentisphaeria bacterium]|nr:cupin domain-containing protein [Lentisphaeria bacterium]
MKEKTGIVFSIAKDNPAVPGCTVSKEVLHDRDSYIAYFSLAEETDISAETFPYYKLLVVAEGDMEVFSSDGGLWLMAAGDCLVTPTGIPIGMRSSNGVVYTEVSINRSNEMNKTIKAGEVFKLAELVPYQEGRIVNMDVLSTETMKFVVMSFDAGTGLSEHAAPGEALIFALDGEGIIGYEGKEHVIHAGENFHFAKGGAHWVKATSRFKMALLLTLE